MRNLLLIVVFAAGCGSENGLNQVPDRPVTGDVNLTGRVCNTETRQWQEGAAVYTHLVNEDGALVQTLTTYTDADGYWTLEALRAQEDYTVYVQYGSAIIDMFDVTMPNDHLVLGEPDCAGGTDVRVAVVTGDYDDFSEVLGSLGIGDYELINGLTGDELVQFLSVTENLTKYDAIFFPGGHIEEDVFYDSDGSDTAMQHEAVKEAVKAYVDGGGVVYASDWSYDVVEQLWPGKIDFLGRDETPDAAQKGEPATLTASIVDGDMAAAIGGETCKIAFDLDAWPVIESVDTAKGAVVHQTATVTWREGFEVTEVVDSPVLVSFESGEGKVVFSSWRQSSNLEGKPLSVIEYMVAGL
jgi:hypothetical protein